MLLALLKEVKLTAPDFRATGDGHIDFDGRLAFAGALSLSQKLTRDLTHAVAELGVLSDPSGRLAIPFSAAGVMPRVDARPDIQALGKSLGGAIVRKGLQQLQEKLPIPKRDRAESPERKDLPAEAEKLLRKGLDWLLRR